MREVKDDRLAEASVIEFLLRAKRETYAGKGGEIASSRPGSHDMFYREGDYLYYDTYLGGECFAGEEALWIGEHPFWSMNYMGRATEEPFPYDFLREALLRVSFASPYRGPARYEKGDYVYSCEASGVFDWFQGKETIQYQGRLVYTCFFHGGLIR